MEFKLGRSRQTSGHNLGRIPVVAIQKLLVDPQLVDVLNSEYVSST